MIEILLMIFSAGILTRIADMIADDGLALGKISGYIIGALYGLIAGYVMVTEPAISELVIAVMLAVIITGKIDHPVHYTAVTSMIMTLVFFGLAPVNIILLCTFLLVGVFDEVMNGLSDRKMVKGIAGRFFGYRLSMEAAAFAVSVFTGQWIILFAIIAYDAGFTYMFPDIVKCKLIRLSKQRCLWS